MLGTIGDGIIEIAVSLAVMLIGLAGTYLGAKLSKRAELQNISIATEELVRMAQTTVEELQQTVADSWKEAAADGKLSRDEVAELGRLLIDGTMQKLSEPVKNLLTASGADVLALIRGAAEAKIIEMKKA